MIQLVTRYAIAFLWLFLAGISAIGCSDQDAADNGLVGNSASKAKAEHAIRSTTSVTPSSQSTETSPAKVDDSLVSEDASPTEVCRQFLKLLKDGKRLSAENLLTRSALAVTGRADLQLEPLGSPEAEYELSQPVYATIQQKLAQVKCRIKDTLDGEAFESDLTWMVRRQKEGWRISGMMIQLQAGQPEDLLSFESLSDVLKIKQSLAAAEAPTERQADASSADLK